MGVLISLQVSLAFADTIVLMATVPNEIMGYHVLADFWQTGYYGCIIHVFSYNIGINASSLSLVAFTVERYVAICYPMKAHTGCTIKRAKKVILVSRFSCIAGCITSCISYIPLIFWFCFTPFSPLFLLNFRYFFSTA